MSSFARRDYAADWRCRMQYPNLVPKQFCTTPVHIVIEKEGLNKYGEPETALETDAMCNYQDMAKTVFTRDKKYVQITGTALIPGDIAPELPTLSGGTAIIFGVKRKIYQGTKARNPDGTVNYVELMLE